MRLQHYTTKISPLSPDQSGKTKRINFIDPADAVTQYGGTSHQPICTLRLFIFLILKHPTFSPIKAPVVVRQGESPHHERTNDEPGGGGGEAAHQGQEQRRCLLHKTTVCGRFPGALQSKRKLLLV